MMKRLLLFLLLPLWLHARLEVAVSYPYIGALTDAVGGGHVDSVILAKGNWDPHFVVPRPSLIAKMRRADALIMNGAQLEIGWLPPLIRRGNNPRVVPGAATFLNLSHGIALIDKPSEVDRAKGDIHPDGNPHFYLDPRNIPLLAQRIAAFLATIDAAHADAYQANAAAFVEQWETHLLRWEQQMAPFRGKQVLQFHDNLAYFNRVYGLVNIGTIEPLPGIPPSSKHTLELLGLIKEQHPCCILHDVYHATKTAEYLQDKTGIRIVLMPHDIGALESVDTLVDLFDYLTGAMRHD